MSITPNFQTPTITIPANGVTTFSANGNYLTNFTSGMVAGTLQLKIGDGRYSRFDAGDTYILPAGSNFDEVTFQNTTGAPVNVQLGCATGEIKVSNAVSVSGTVTTTAVGGTTLATVADVPVLTTATTKVSSGSATDHTAIISNLLANGTVIRVGDANTGAARGAEVPIGGSISLDAGADIYVYNPAVGTINIGVLKVKT